MSVLSRTDPSLSDVDPEIAELMREERAPAQTLRLIPSENYVSRAVLEATRLACYQQVLRGLPGQALLRGPAVHRPGRGARARAREGALRRRARQRAALLGLAGEPRRLPRVLQARRHRHGHGAAGGRPPHARLERLDHRQVLPRGAVRRAHARPAASTSTRCASSRASEQPEAHLLRRHGDPAHDRLRRLRRDRARGRRDPRRRHRAHRRARRRRRAPVAGRPRRRGHDDDAQDAARPARRHDHVQRGARRRAIDKAVFPGLQGGPHNHTTAAIAVALQRGARSRRSRTYAHQIVANAKALADGARRARLRPRHGRHRQPPDPHRPHAARTSPASPRRRRSTAPGIVAELQHGAVRPAQAVRPVGPPPRHAGGHDPRDDRARDGADRRLDGRGGAGRAARGRRGLERIAGEVRELLAGFPMPGCIADPAH